jgi:hypothetical protein
MLYSNIQNIIDITKYFNKKEQLKLLFNFSENPPHYVFHHRLSNQD